MSTITKTSFEWIIVAWVGNKYASIQMGGGGGCLNVIVYFVIFKDQFSYIFRHFKDQFKQLRHILSNLKLFASSKGCYGCVSMNHGHMSAVINIAV